MLIRVESADHIDNDSMSVDCSEKEFATSKVETDPICKRSHLHCRHWEQRLQGVIGRGLGHCTLAFPERISMPRRKDQCSYDCQRKIKGRRMQAHLVVLRKVCVERATLQATWSVTGRTTSRNGGTLWDGAPIIRFAMQVIGTQVLHTRTLLWSQDQ